MIRIYVASSWRNVYQPEIVSFLRAEGHEVYDFRVGSSDGSDSRTGFHWSEIGPDWEKWDACDFRAALQHPAAERGFEYDKGGMDWADICVLLLPCGRSAHLEAGYMAGQGKRVIIALPEDTEPELMYKLCAAITVSHRELAQEVLAL